MKLMMSSLDKEKGTFSILASSSIGQRKGDILNSCLFLDRNLLYRGCRGAKGSRRAGSLSRAQPRQRPHAADPQEGGLRFGRWQPATRNSQSRTRLPRRARQERRRLTHEYDKHFEKRGKARRHTGTEPKARTRTGTKSGGTDTKGERDMRRAGGCRTFCERAPICKPRMGRSLRSLYMSPHATNAAHFGLAGRVEQLKPVHSSSRLTAGPSASGPFGPTQLRVLAIATFRD